MYVLIHIIFTPGSRNSSEYPRSCINFHNLEFGNLRVFISFENLEFESMCLGWPEKVLYNPEYQIRIFIIVRCIFFELIMVQHYYFFFLINLGLFFKFWIRDSGPLFFISIPCSSVIRTSSIGGAWTRSTSFISRCAASSSSSTIAAPRKIRMPISYGSV